MRTLDLLGRFIRAKDTEEEHEVRDYAVQHAADLSEAFGVTEATFRAGLSAADDDANLARKLLADIKNANRERREARAGERATAAQLSADTLGAFAHWEGDHVAVDIVSILAACLTGRDHVLVFTGEDWTVGVSMARLFDLARLGRVDLTAFVDEGGLHVRWGTGALNFRSNLIETNASKIVVNLPSRTATMAA